MGLLAVLVLWKLMVCLRVFAVLELHPVSRSKPEIRAVRGRRKGVISYALFAWLIAYPVATAPDKKPRATLQPDNWSRQHRSVSVNK
jgi:hypothetical protein